jgi:hypothetical protein
MNANAQWVQMSNGMDSVSVNALVSSGNNIFAGTTNYTIDSSGVYISTNSGISWAKTSLNNKMIFSLLINGTNVLAGTWRNGVYLSTNNGMSWNQTSLNSGTIYCFALSGNNIFAGTQDSGIYISTNNGTNWTRTSLNNKTVHALTISNNNIFAGTDWNGIYLSTNNGISWTQTSFPTNTIVKALTINANNIYAGAGKGVYISTNNGMNWTRTILDSNYLVFSLAVSSQNIIAGTLMGIYLSTNNGINWTGINQGFNIYPFAYSLIISNNYIFVGTDGQSVWRRPLSELISIQNISTETPSKYSLSQNYPNPFNPSTVVSFQLSVVSDVSLKVYDVQGREVQTLVNERLNAGTYEVKFDGSSLNSGVYFYKIVADGYSETKRMILIK